LVVARYWMCGVSRESQSEYLPVFDGYQSACTTDMVATFPRVIGDELTVFWISVKSWLVMATICCWMKKKLIVHKPEVS